MDIFYLYHRRINTHRSLRFLFISIRIWLSNIIDAKLFWTFFSLGVMCNEGCNSISMRITYRIGYSWIGSVWEYSSDHQISIYGEKKRKKTIMNHPQESSNFSSWKLLIVNQIRPCMKEWRLFQRQSTSKKIFLVMC